MLEKEFQNEITKSPQYSNTMRLAHWGQNNSVVILQTPFLNTFWQFGDFDWYKFHLRLFQSVQLTVSIASLHGVMMK